MIDNLQIGYISIMKHLYSEECGKNVYLINCELYIEKLYDIQEQSVSYSEPSKFPMTNIDYTFVIDKKTDFEELNDIISKYDHKYLMEYRLIDIYESERKNVTITFLIGSDTKTLSKEDIDEFQEDILSYIEANELKVMK